MSLKFGHWAQEEPKLWQQLHEALPPRLVKEIIWLYARNHWEVITIVFRTPDGGEKQVNIPNSEWLNDATIARLCLECP